MEGVRFILCPCKCAGKLVLMSSMRHEDPDSGWVSAQTFQVSVPKEEAPFLEECGQGCWGHTWGAAGWVKAAIFKLSFQDKSLPSNGSF